jgi:hypothetical protein
MPVDETNKKDQGVLFRRKGRIFEVKKLYFQVEKLNSHELLQLYHGPTVHYFACRHPSIYRS